jgi:4-azaleucine resistance transporter AzlC
VRAEAPILLGVAPFGVIFGALAVTLQLPALAAQSMSSVIFAGSAQFIAAQMLGAGAPGLLVVLVVLVVNLRHALYSASVAPHLRHLGPGWKAVLAYLLTDEAYAVTITHYNEPGPAANRHWFFLGAGLTLWTTWQLSTLAGILVGAQLPQDWPLGFVLPLTFIALVVPSIRDRAGLTAGIVGGLAGLAFIALPYRTGILAGALLGIAAGMVVDSRRR